MAFRSFTGSLGWVLASTLALGTTLGTARLQPEALSPQAPERPEAVACVAGVARLGWMTGEWSHADGSGAWEERWSPPLGGCMVGSLRWVRGGKPAMYEMLALEEDAQGHVRMFIRHFGAGLEAWKSEQGAPTPTWVLTSVERGRAVFEDPARDFPAKITYTASFENERTISLGVRLEGVENGATRVIDFEFGAVTR